LGTDSVIGSLFGEGLPSTQKYYKSSATSLHYSTEEMDLVSTHLGCGLEKFPLSYLGITYCATPTCCLFRELCMPSFHNAE
jgi:hypothetical protein